MTLTSLDQQGLFTAADLVEVTAPHQWVQPDKGLDPEFRISRGEFPVAKDKALIEEEKTDVR